MTRDKGGSLGCLGVTRDDHGLLRMTRDEWDD